MRECECVYVCVYIYIHVLYNVEVVRLVLSAFRETRV